MSSNRGSREPAPGWLPDAEARLRDLLRLPENWDSYRARRVEPAVVDSAVQLLRGIARLGMPAPTVVPTAPGGVQLEWNLHSICFEVELITPERVAVLFEDSRKCIEWEGDLRDLSRW